MDTDEILDLIIQNSNCGEYFVFEGMTSVSALINANNNGALSNDRRIAVVLFDKSKLKSKKREYDYLRHCSETLSFEIRLCDTSLLESVTTGRTHGGVAAITTGRTISMLNAENIVSEGFYAYIDGIEDPYNFGYSIRSLYASGADGIVISERNWMNASGIVAKSSAGTSELIPMFKVDSPQKLCETFRGMGYKIVSAGIRNSVSLFDADMKKPILLIVGGEKRGISRAVLDNSDSIVRIDYGRTFLGSLPTASAVSVMAYEVFRQNRKPL